MRERRVPWRVPLVLAALSLIAALGTALAAWMASRSLTASCVETTATHARFVWLWIGFGTSAAFGVPAFGALLVSRRPPTIALYIVIVILAVNVGVCVMAVVGSEPCVRLTGR